MHQVTSHDGTRIAYDSYGAGPPVLLVGGALCDRASNQPLAEELAGLGFTGVTYDRRGRGDSTDVAGPGIDNEVADIAAVVGAFPEAPALYGHSSGAALALHAAASGIALTHLVLHEAPFNVNDPEAAAVSRRYREDLDALVAAGDAAGAAAHFMRTVGMPEEALAGIQAEPWWAGMVAIAPTLVHDSEVMGDRQGGTVPEHLLPEVGAPTLILYGDASPPWMLDVATQMAERLPDARVQVLEGQEHVVEAEILAPVLATFLAGRPSGSVPSAG